MPDELPTKLTLSVGQERTIKLPSAAGAGYRWHARVDDERTVEADARFAAAETTAEGKPVFSAHELLTLHARNPGTARVTCTQRRGWEDETAALASQTITVTVVAAADTDR